MDSYGLTEGSLVGAFECPTALSLPSLTDLPQTMVSGQEPVDGENLLPYQLIVLVNRDEMTEP